MNEGSYKQSIHKLIDKSVVDVWSISDRMKAGVPDVEYSGNSGRSLWIEYKYDEIIPTTISINKKLTANQLNWLNTRFDRGHDVIVVYGAEKSKALILEKKDLWNTPFSSEYFRKNAISKKELANWIHKKVNKW